MKRYFSLIFAGAVMATGLSVAGEAAVYVRVAPPRPVVERVVPRPRGGMVWVGGYYRWTGRAYVWTPGRWAHPPRPAAVWVAPHWDFVAGRGYVFVAGFWR
jgi:hypothetical protein